MSYDSPTVTALQSGLQVSRDYLTIYGRDGDDNPVTFGFWTGVDNVSVNVVSAIDGSTVARDFIGGGTLLDVPPVVDTVGLESRGIDFGLSQIESNVQDMVRAYNIRVSVVELHRGVISPDTWALVSTPFPRFLGRVDGVTVETPAVDGEGSITLSTSPDTIDLTRTSPAIKSDATQRLRSGDRFRRHSDSAGEIEIWWGQARGAA